MSEQIREQVSAFLDGELPNSESELLLKRLVRDAELRESFGRYALVGECLRGGGRARLSRSFAARVNCAIDGAGPGTDGTVGRGRSPVWWRPFAGAAIAAGVAAVAVVALQQRAVAPSVRVAVAVSQRGGAAAPSPTSPQGSPDGQPRLTRFGAGEPDPVVAGSREPYRYTVPAPVIDGAAGFPTMRLTNYVVAHYPYSTGLYPSTAGVLADDEARDPPADDTSFKTRLLRQDSVSPQDSRVVP